MSWRSKKVEIEVKELKKDILSIRVCKLQRNVGFMQKRLVTIRGKILGNWKQHKNVRYQVHLILHMRQQSVKSSIAKNNARFGIIMI